MRCCQHSSSVAAAACVLGPVAACNEPSLCVALCSRSRSARRARSRLRTGTGSVVSIGDKCVSVKVGDTVVYSKFGIGVTDLEIKGEEFAVLKEEDIIGVFPTDGAAATASDVASLRPLFDRVLVKARRCRSDRCAQVAHAYVLAQVAEAKAATKGGVLLPESAKEKPVVGEVLATGPGKEKEEMKLVAGDKVVYFKYGGDKMMDDKGAEYGAPHVVDQLHALRRTDLLSFPQSSCTRTTSSANCDWRW